MVLELACGTGSLSIEMAKRGYEMIGLIYPAICCPGRKKSPWGTGLTSFSSTRTCAALSFTVLLTLCVHADSINYITEKSDLERVFRLVSMYLNPDGLFIFDINSEYKLSCFLAENTFFELDDAISWIWHNTYDPSSKLCVFELTFFRKTHNGLYARFDETHIERALVRRRDYLCPN